VTDPQEIGADMAVDEAPERKMPSSQPLLLRALRWGAIAGVLLILAFVVIGSLLDGSRGAIGGGLGAAFSVVFLSLTIGSIAFANRYYGQDLYTIIFFALIVGSWLLKFVAFIIAAVLLRDQPWLNPTILFLGVIAGVIFSLIIDALVILRSRMPYVSDS
jgi:hypothetical protein